MERISLIINLPRQELDFVSRKGQNNGKKPITLIVVPCRQAQNISSLRDDGKNCRDHIYRYAIPTGFDPCPKLIRLTICNPYGIFSVFKIHSSIYMSFRTGFYSYQKFICLYINLAGIVRWFIVSYNKLNRKSCQ